MQRQSGSIRNKLMLACALVVAAAFATPAAMAHGAYRGHGGNGADVLGALVVGAVIGGVLVSASQHDHDYYRGGYAYPAPAYPQGYYGGYPAYSYGGGYGYPSYGSVNVGVVYSHRGDGYRGHGGQYYNRNDHNRPRGHSGYYNHHGR